jgi:hypothetical protein
MCEDDFLLGRLVQVRKTKEKWVIRREVREEKCSKYRESLGFGKRMSKILGDMMKSLLN